MSSRGYIGAFDSLLALCIVGLAIMLAFTRPIPAADPNGSQRPAMAHDFLEQAYGLGILSDAASGSTARAQAALLSFPFQSCPVLSISDANGSLVSSVAKPGCIASGKERVVVYKAFCLDGKPYAASLASWYP